MTVPDARTRAARLAARAQIVDVRMFSFDASLVSMPIDEAGAITYDFDFTNEIAYDEDRQVFTVTGQYSVRIKQPQLLEEDEDSATEVDLANLNFKLAGLFELSMREGDEPPEEEEFLAFAATTGTMALYPFAREFVYDATGRMGLPALTLRVATVVINPPT